MAVTGINGTTNYPVYTSGKATKGVSNGDFSGQVRQTEETKKEEAMTPEEEMQAFKKEFYAELEKIPQNRTIVNLAINISDEAFENMKADPKYREQILAALRRDITSSFAPLKASMVLTVGATAKDYRGDSWSGSNNYSEFYARSQNSFYKKTNESRKDRQKELLEEYVQKRQEKKRLQQAAYEKAAMEKKIAHQRLLAEDREKELAGKRVSATTSNVAVQQAAAASYEASFLVADSGAVSE